MIGEATQAALNLRALEVRVVRSGERERFGELIDEHHYLGYQPIVGESLCYVATHGSDWGRAIGMGLSGIEMRRQGPLDWLATRGAMAAVASDRQQCALPDSPRGESTQRGLADLGAQSQTVKLGLADSSWPSHRIGGDLRRQRAL